MAGVEKYQRFKVCQDPFCLIYTTTDGSFTINEEALCEIRQINEPLLIVAIVGLYRTGKSYLMNCLAERSTGFPLGNTIQAKTKGIWGLCKVIHTDGKDKVILLLDAEGLGDAAKGDTDHDHRLFTLATLLCNVLVYNKMSVFDQDAIEKLTFITEISKRILFKNKFKSNKDEKQIELILPTLVLCLRDFQLSLEKDDMPLTPCEYMEDCLKFESGDDERTKKFNKPRESIIRYFPKRECYVFDRPGDRDAMKKLDTAKPDELSKSFLKDSQAFKQFIYSCGPKVLLSSKPVNGTTNSSIMVNNEAIKDGAVPNVDDAIETAARIENNRLVKEAVENFRKGIGMIELPILQTKEFDELYQKGKRTALAAFRLESVFDSKKYEKDLTTELDTIWEKVKKDNHEHVRSYCEKEIQKMYKESIGEKRQLNKYNVSGGYLSYKSDVGNLKRDFKAKKEGTDHADVLEVLHKFMESEADVEGNIMMNDQKLTQEDVQKEMERIHKENREAQKEMLASHERRLKEEKERAEKHNEKLEAERKAHIKREEEKVQLLQKEWQNQKDSTENQLKMMEQENKNIKQEMNDNKSNAEQTRKMLEEQLQREKVENAKRQETLADELKNLKDKSKTQDDIPPTPTPTSTSTTVLVCSIS